jgi:sugar lactone lactonase YvrE
LHCKVVSPVNGHPAANGVLLVDDGKTLLVNEIVEATTTVYDVDSVSKMLTVRKKVVSQIDPQSYISLMDG